MKNVKSMYHKLSETEKTEFKSIMLSKLDVASIFQLAELFGIQ